MIFHIFHQCLLRIDRWWDKKLHQRQMRKLNAMTDEELLRLAGVTDADSLYDEELDAALKRTAGGEG